MGKSKDRRVFSGWDRPIADLVVEHLVRGHEDEEGTYLDLEGTLIVVPTRQAGRRLRETFARWCEDHGRTLLSAKVVTPHYFFGQKFLPSNVAGKVARHALWIDVLMKTDTTQYPALFPSVISERNFQWANSTAELLEDLRQELADAVLTIGDVVEKHGDSLEEPERWAEMQAIERAYLESVERHGFADSCTAKIQCVSHAADNLEADRVVVAAVPDPALLAVEALGHIAAKADVEVLVHAPQDSSNIFDEWGRPLSGKWLEREVDIPEFDESVFLEMGAPEQSRRLLRLLHEHTEDYESGELAIGVPDTGIVPFIEKDLSAEGLPPFDPSDLRVSEHALGRLAADLLAVIQGCSYEAVSTLIRHPDFAEYLAGEHELDMSEVLTQLDQFQNYYLPVNFDNMLVPFRDNPKGVDDWRYDFTDLGIALNQLNVLLREFESSGFESGWRQCFRTVYAGRTLNSADTGDTQFESAAMEMDAVLRGFRELDNCGCGLTKTQLSSIFVHELDGATFHAERRDEVVDLEGWLELPWNNRPFMLLTGFNDNCVPGGSLSDAFLPDTLRAKLGLRDDRARFARDIYLLTGIIESRRANGRVCIMVGKTSSAGDPLRPSRLLFRCSDEELPRRVERLLASVEDTRPRHASEVIFPLRPAAAERSNDIPVRKKMSVTAFRDYLECPFRFYLSRVLEMEELDDRKTELDQMDFGNIVHAVLEMMGCDRKLWGCKDPVKLGTKLGKLAEDEVRARYSDPLPLSVHISLMSAIQRLKGAARVQAELVEEGWEILEAEAGQDCETRRRWQLERRGFVISGRIDRIDRNTHTGAVRIIDYKTSDKAVPPVKVHLRQRKDDVPDWNSFSLVKASRGKVTSRDYKWIDLQLPIYAMIYAAGKPVPEDLQVAYFNLPKAVSHTGVYVWDDFGKAHVESAEKCIDGALDSIAGGIFWEPADKVRYENFEAFFHNEPEKAFDLEGFGGVGKG